MLKKSFYGGLGLFGAIFVLIFILPSFINWNDYRPRLAQAINQSTGLPVHIGGDLKVVLLPVPGMQVTDITLGDLSQEESKPMMVLDALEIRLAFWPLLQGVIAFETVLLDSPVLHLRRFADGSNNWELAPKPAQNAGDLSSQSGPDSDFPSAFSVKIADIRIIDGLVIYEDGRGEEFQVTQINLDMAASSLEGPFSGSGEGEIRGVPVAIRFATDSIEANQPLGLDFTMMVDESGQIRVQGDLDMTEDKPGFSGTLDVSGASLQAAFMTGTALMTPEEKATPFPEALEGAYRLTGEVGVADQELTINRMQIKLGELQAKGGINTRFDEGVELDLALVFGQIDLDALLPMMAGGATPAASPESASGREQMPPSSASPDSRLAASPFVMKVNIAASAVLYRGKAIQEVNTDMTVADSILLVDRLEAQLPGGGNLMLSGNVDFASSPVALESDLRIHSDNLQAGLKWLGVDVSQFPKDRLRRFSMAATLTGDMRRFDLEEVAIQIDQSRIRAASAVSLGARPGLGINFAIDTLDGDAYWPLKSGQEAGMEIPDEENSDEAKPGLFSGLPGLSGHWLDLGFDANILGRVESLIMGGRLMQDVSLDLSLREDTLTIGEMKIEDIAGVQAVIDGEIDGSKPLPELGLSFMLSTDDLEASLQKLATPAPFPGSPLGALKATGRIDGGINAAQGKAVIDAAGGKLVFEGRVDSLLLSPKAEVTFDANFPSLQRVAGLWVSDYPRGGKPEPLTLKGRLGGAKREWKLTEFVGNLGEQAVYGEGELNLEGETPYIRADLRAETLFLDSLFPSAPPRIRQGFFPHGHQNPARGEGYDRFTGQITKVALSSPSHSLSSAWSSDAYDVSALSAIDGDFSFEGKTLTWGQYRLQSPRMRVALKQGQARFAPVSGQIFGGEVTMEGKLDARAQPVAELALSARDIDLASVLAAFGSVNTMTGDMALQLDIQARGESEAALISSLSGQSQLLIDNGVIKGIDLEALSQNLQELQGAISVVNLLETVGSGGKTPLDTIKADFVIEKGLVTGRDIFVASQSGQGILAAEIDLPRRSLAATGQFSLKDHPNAPPIGVQITGLMSQPDWKIDSRAFEAYLLEKGVGALLGEFLPDVSGSASASGKGNSSGKGNPSGKGSPSDSPGAAASSSPSQSSPSQSPSSQPLPSEPASPLRSLEDDLNNILEQIFP